MPQALPAIAAAFSTVTAAVSTFATALTFKAGLMAGLGAWAKVATYTALGASLLMKPPGLASSGQQVNVQMAGPQAPLPVVIGRTGTQGIITYRATYGGDNRNLVVEHIHSIGPIDTVESWSVMGRTLGLSGNPLSGMATVTSVSGVDMVKSKLFRESGLKVAHRLGSHTDTATLSSITGEAVPLINSTHTNPGLARTIVRCRLDEKRLNFPQGYPDDPTAVVRGVKCYDPRKDSTYPGGSGSHRHNDPATHEWSENPFVVGLQFALGWRDPSGGKLFGLGADFDQIDVGSFVSAANVADANSWKVGGQVTSADGDWAILTNILASGGGVPLDRGGRLSCFVRSPKVATFTLRSDEVLGSRKVTTSTSFRDRVNTIIPSCRQEAQKWEVVAGQAVSVSDWIADDGGEIRTEEIAFPLVSSYAQAHQLATYWLCDSREFLELEVTAKPRALNVDVGDCIEVELPEFADGQTFIVMGRKWDAATKTVGLTLKSETFAKHAFALGQSQTPPTPPTLDTFDPTRPSGPAALDWAITANKIETTEEVEVPAEDPENPPVTITRARTIIPALVISGEVRDPNVQRIIVEVREQTVPEEGEPFWPEDEDSGWVSGTEGTRDATELTVAPLKPLTEYEVSVRYETLTGAFSERIILGPEQTARDQAGGVGPGTVDWDDPQGPLINVPGVLRDLLDGQIRANLVAIEGEVNQTVQAAYLAAEAARTDLDNRVTADISRIDGLITLTDPEAGTPGRRILDTAIEAEEALGRIDGLEVVIGAPAEGEPGGSIRSRIAGLELITTDGSLVTAETLATVQAAVDGLSANSVAHTTAIGDLESSRATVTALNAVQTSADARNRTFAQDAQPTGSPGGIGIVVGDLWMDTDDDNRIYRWSGTAWVNTDNGGSDALAELETARGTFPNLNARFGTLSTTVSDALAGKAAATDFTTLQTEVTNARGGASSLADRLTTVQSALDGKASASDVTALSSSVSVRNRTFRQASAPTSPIGGYPLVAGDIWIDTSANNTIHWWTGSAWSGSADPRIATSAQGVTDLTAKIGTVSGTVADALAGKASASSVTSLSATVADHTSSISSLQSVTASLDGTVDAKVGLVLNVNGKISGFSSANNGTTSTFDIQADVFRLANGSTAVVPFAVIGSTVYAQNLVMQASVSGQGTTTVSPNGLKVVDASGVTRVKLGLLALL